MMEEKLFVSPVAQYEEEIDKETGEETEEETEEKPSESEEDEEDLTTKEEDGEWSGYIK